MSPTVFRSGPYRFYFFSREEPRVHIHALSPDGEAKFWLEPQIELATYAGFNKQQLKDLEKLVQEHQDEILEAWRNHFG